MMKKFCQHLCICLVVVLVAPNHALSESIVLSDQDFFAEDWTPVVHVTDDTNVAGAPPLTSTASITRRSTGGNPGAYFQSNLTGIVLGDSLTTTGIYIEESYDPRQRAISTVDYSFSVSHFFATGDTNVAIALLQSGRMFVGPAQGFTGNQWVTRSGSGLDADDFLAIDFFITGTVIRPDFSAFGDPIQFGYAIGNVVVPGSGGDPFVRGMDNWSVTLNLAEMSDIDGDGVDSGDLAFWEAGYGIEDDALLADGDFNLDGDVDGLDFLKWQRQFGTGVPLRTTTSVPEPNFLTILALFATAGRCFQRRALGHRSKR